MHDPRKRYQEAVYQIIRYLKGCPGRGLMFSRHGHLKIEGYTDADRTGALDDRKSTSGYCTFLGSNLVTWRSKKQNVVARSSAEAEYRALAQGVCKVIWLKQLMTELRLSRTSPMSLFCDNKTAINIANNPVQHDRIKYIEIDRHFIKEKLDQRVIYLTFIKSSEQLADIYTKGLSTPIFSYICNKMGLHDIFAPS